MKPGDPTGPAAADWWRTFFDAPFRATGPEVGGRVGLVARRP